MPGPLIVGKKGDQFRINVVNLLNDTTMVTTTSIHWHGIFQQGTNWADGPIGVTQCPIIPGDSFLYQFTVPNQAGTFWYHSHHLVQYCDGLRGPLVVYDPNDPYLPLYDVDDESTVITLSDWDHPPSPSQPVDPNYDAVLVNGLGRYVGGPASPLAVIHVKANTRYRFRLVSISCDPDFTFSIDNHTMTIIEVDGVATQPLKVDSIDIYAGQRYSFILKANQPIANYWIRSVPGPGPTGFDGGINSAILRYIGAPIADPKTPEEPSTNPLLETSLVPLNNPGAPGAPYPGGADINILLNITFNETLSTYYINNATFDPPRVPVLLQILSGAKTAQELLPPGSVYVLPRDKVVEVTIPGGSADSPHPFHLHGQTFSVVRSAGSTNYNYRNPVRRDVVDTGIAGDNVTFRFTTHNPGPWILHWYADLWFFPAPS
ncbi:multicopper oxidase [Amanita muscaria Koide BX008]|uniref:Multicopper oxidase n=1 Tax=Amanita muscaria (strain Koide BX008) TaxID=946122 RepID=A0A0C2S7Y3_AMAMK|nr:multicopper oxidase [Amanita muscaria Koide BX008]